MFDELKSLWQECVFKPVIVLFNLKQIRAGKHKNGKKKISKPFCINSAHCITIKPFKEKPLIPV